MYCLFPFLWTATILDLFQLFGNILEVKELRNIVNNDFTIVESQIFIIYVNMLSWSWSLLMSHAQMIFEISLSSKSVAEIVPSLKQSLSVVIDT